MNDKTSPVQTHEETLKAAAAPPAAADASPGKAADTIARRVIKRYSNRKLYDTQDSRYVTLLQIAEMVRGGEEVQIIDNNSKEDLTEVTLAQIIYEEQKAHSRSVPLQTLKELIHQRTEKVLTELREGPIGRLLPGSRPDAGTNGEHADSSADHDAQLGAHPPASASTRSIVDHARGTLDEWRQEVDERVKAILPSFLPWVEMNNEIKRLKERVEELETRLNSPKS